MDNGKYQPRAALTFHYPFSFLHIQFYRLSYCYRLRYPYLQRAPINEPTTTAVATVPITR